uniref:Uncharacterized protein n=1 Tax=Leersia perrieri TaxID=77586 RepID=A0A0D9XQB2_9ORYZ
MPNILSAVKSCCRYNGTARACYTACCWLASEETCAKRCDCILIPRNSGVDRCPEGYRSLTIIPDFEGLESIEYCRLGCRSFVCSNMNSVDDTKEKATIVERCSEGCDRFCSRDASIASVAA